MRFIKPALVCVALGLTGCSTITNFNYFGLFGDDAETKQAKHDAAVAAAEKAAVPEPEPRQIIKLGISSNTVESKAKEQGCMSKTGAELITSNGPIETYKVTCDDGSEYSARCEFRQCKITRG